MRKLLLLAATACALAAAVLLFRHAGLWLIVEDPPAHSAAVFVLAGEAPFRAMEAAEVYRQGWAPEVWLAPMGRRRSELHFAKLGLEIPNEREFNRAVLIRLGVPATAIRTLETEVWDTFDEIRAGSNQLSRTGAKILIIATSQYHTRRVRMLWKALARPDQELIVRPARQDGFRAAGWWNNTSDILTVTREVMGIFNIWLGFPVRTRRN